MKRNAIERLAREICWREFLAPESVGKTKAAYWRDLPEISKDEYRNDARFFARVLNCIDEELRNDLLTT